MIPWIKEHWVIIVIILAVIAVSVFIYFAYFHYDQTNTVNSTDNSNYDPSQTPATSSIPLSQRMNPGNLRNLKDKNGNPLVVYDGEIQPNDDAFKHFQSWEYGFRAMAMNLYAYLKGGFNTIATIIPKWAPAGDKNNPSVYISDVSGPTGIDPNQTLTKADFSNDNYKNIMYYMSKVEQGSNFDPSVGIDAGYSDFLNAVSL